MKTGSLPSVFIYLLFFVCLFCLAGPLRSLNKVYYDIHMQSQTAHLYYSGHRFPNIQDNEVKQTKP